MPPLGGRLPGQAPKSASRVCQSRGHLHHRPPLPPPEISISTLILLLIAYATSTCLSFPLFHLAPFTACDSHTLAPTVASVVPRFIVSNTQEGTVIGVFAALIAARHQYLSSPLFFSLLLLHPQALPHRGRTRSAVFASFAIELHSCPFSRHHSSL